MFQAPVSSTRAVRRTLRWIVLLPVVMVGSLLYWSVAISMGGMSLLAATALSASTTTFLPGASGSTDSPGLESGATIELQDSAGVGSGAPGTILVHLEESAEPGDDTNDDTDDVNDNPGAVTMTPAADDYAVSKPGPGTTSY